MAPVLRLGSRGSTLALAQTHAVCDRLAAADPALAEPGAVEVVVIRTTGDRVRDRPLAEIGGKGLFIKEIEEALQAGAIDAAVHSMKDVPGLLPPGLVIAATLPREDPRDAYFSRSGADLDALPPGAEVGSASPRRAAQVLARRPDLRVVTLRGNVETRLRKLGAGDCDATLLAVAGLRRLGLGSRIGRVLDPDEMLPAVAQGAIGIECRADDRATLERMAAVDCAVTSRRVAAERGLLAALDGSCRTPIAALAEIDAAGGLALDGLIALPDGTGLHRVRRTGPAADAAAIGADAGAALRAAAGEAFLALCRAG
jgi:hydroxymethylbilane synthase